MNKKYNEPKDSVLTNSMDTKSKEFKEFQKLIEVKVNTLSDDDKLTREMVSLKIKMED